MKIIVYINKQFFIEMKIIGYINKQGYN